MPRFIRPLVVVLGVLPTGCGKGSAEATNPAAPTTQKPGKAPSPVPPPPPPKTAR